VDPRRAAPAPGRALPGDDAALKPDPDDFARLLCGYCLEARAGQQIIVGSTTPAAPLLLSVQRELLERGAWPLMRVELPGADEVFYAAAGDAHLDGFAPAELAEVQAVDATLRIVAPENVNALAGVDPARLARAARAREPLREALLGRRWALTHWPTPASAQQAGMATGDYAAFVERALFLDRSDPAAAWGELSAFQGRLVERVSEARTLRIEGEGTDLTLSVARRTWINSDGRRNMPSGEIFTGPVEDSAEGRIRFSLRSAHRGVTVEGVVLELREGRVVSARAERGDAYLQATLATDDGARALGEIGIGTNFGIDRPVGSTLFDEKIGGTVHLALGRSYPETGGVNRSAIHWDLICDLRSGGRLSADGETIMEDGEFT
jgi:aminopeptidase